MTQRQLHQAGQGKFRNMLGSDGIEPAYIQGPSGVQVQGFELFHLNEPMDYVGIGILRIHLLPIFHKNTEMWLTAIFTFITTY